jgi:hypothetical protein
MANMKRAGNAYSGSDQPMDNTKSNMGGNGNKGGGGMSNKGSSLVQGDYNSKMGGGDFKPGPDSALNKGPFNK